MSNLGHRWYRLYHYRGKPDELASGLAAYVRRRGLSDTVVSLSLEKRPGKEFYFILGVVTETPFVLGDAEDALTDCPLLKGYVSDHASPEEFGAFATGELRLTTLGQTIQYRRMQRESLDDPFAGVPIREPRADNKSNELLWYLSSLGRGSWTVFQRACGALGMDGQGEAARMARTLRVLGHLELAPDGSEWSVTPRLAVSARTQAGTLTFLTGARDACLDGTTTAQYLGPDRVELSSEEGVYASENLARELPSVMELISGYTEVGSVDPYANKLHAYEAGGFAAPGFTGKPGFYRVLTPRDRTLHLLLDANGAWRSGDWYSLRYFHLAINGQLVELEYDPSTWQLAVMADQRPPEAYERALVLASGLMPQVNNGWVLYENISPELASDLAARMGTKIQESVS